MKIKRIEQEIIKRGKEFIYEDYENGWNIDFSIKGLLIVLEPIGYDYLENKVVYFADVINSKGKLLARKEFIPDFKNSEWKL